jgi:hypothetical protein
MILEPDISLTRVVLVGDVELVARAIRALVHVIPFVNVNAIRSLAIYIHFDQISVASDLDVVPLTDGFHRIVVGGDEVVNRARVVKAGRLRVVDGNLDPVEAHVLIGSR